MRADLLERCEPNAIHMVEDHQPVSCELDSAGTSGEVRCCLGDTRQRERGDQSHAQCDLEISIVGLIGGKMGPPQNTWHASSLGPLDESLEIRNGITSCRMLESICVVWHKDR